MKIPVNFFAAASVLIDMFCDKCGAQLQEGQAFCSSCGKSFQTQAAPVPPVAGPPLDGAENRVAKHTRTLAILWIIWSVFHLLPAMLFFGMGSMAMPFMHGFRQIPFLGPFMAVFGGLVVICSVAGIIAGWGLLSFQPWGRMLAIVLGCFALINIPFGTALGIFTLWVLLPRPSEEQYRRLANQQAG